MIRRYNGSSWQDVSFIRKYNGSSWQDVQYVNKYNGSSWTKIYPLSLDIYNSGKIYKPFSILKNSKTYYDTTNTSNRQLTFNSNNITMWVYSYWGYNRNLMTTDPIDITSYQQLHLHVSEYYCHDGYTANYIGKAGFGIIASKVSPAAREYYYSPTQAGDKIADYVAHEERGTNKEIILDISSLSGNYYLGIITSNMNWNDSTAQITITRLWIT